MKDRKELTEEDKEYGQFLVDFLNCTPNPEDINALIGKCFDILERYLGYRNTRWEGLVLEYSFSDLVHQVEPNYFANFVRPWIQYQFWGGEDRPAYRNLDEHKKERIQACRERSAAARQINWGEDNKRMWPYFVFYLEFHMARKMCRKLFTEIGNGKTMEELQDKPWTGELLLRLKKRSEHTDCKNQVVIKGNRIFLQPVVTDPQNISFSLNDFFNGYFMLLLDWCFHELSRDERKERLGRVRRCPDCGEFFFGRTNKKWHAEECKNRANVKAFRDEKKRKEEEEKRKKKEQKRALQKEREEAQQPFWDYYGGERDYSREPIKGIISKAEKEALTFEEYVRKYDGQYYKQIVAWLKQRSKLTKKRYIACGSENPAEPE